MLEKIVNELTARGYDVMKETVSKNGIKMNGIVFKNNEVCAPVLYIDEDSSVESNVERMINQINNMQNPIAADDILSMLTNWDLVKNHIIKVLKYKTDDDVISDDFYGMKIEYRIHFPAQGEGMASSAITKNQLKTWNVSETEVKESAKVPGDMCIKSLREIIEMHTSEPVEDYPCDAPCFFVMSNASCLNGASMILSEEFSKVPSIIGCEDFYLIPSSIHEMLLISTKGIDVESINTMIREVNNSSVSPTEILSYNALRYSNGEISIAA